MIIGSIPAAIRPGPDCAARPVSDGVDTMSAAAARAVVPLMPVDRTGPTPVSRPDVAFVAHLIATAARSPQTRDLRRASPDAVRAAYDATLLRNAAADAQGRPTVTRTA